MRRPSKRELGLLIGVVIATGVAHADEGGNIPEITVNGYQEDPFVWFDSYANDMRLSPLGGSGPGGAYSANPNSHVNCAAKALRAAETSNGDVSPTNPAPQPNNTSLTVPIRYDNPIDISNGSPIGAQYGAVNGSAGFMVFPSLAAGTWAANASMGNLANAGQSITQMINAWAPPEPNPNAMGLTLTALGITQSLANETLLSQLTATQATQLLAAFAWQEGFKPAGC